MFFSSIAVANLLSGEIYTINKESVTIRTAPATNSQAVDSIDQGSDIIIDQEQNGWYKVRYMNTAVGWVPKWYLESDDLVSDQNLAAEILLTTPIFAEQSEDSIELARVDAGEYLYVNYESNGWVQIVYDNQYGYIPTETVSFISRDDIPTAAPDDGVDEEEDSNLYAELEAASKIIIVRQNNQAFLDGPDIYSDIIYTPAYNQRFELIDTLQDASGEDVYFVEDEDGIRGYLESRITAKASDYYDHIGTTTVDSISEAVIMIDAGHGGEDPGAISRDDETYEKHVTLFTAQKLQEKLENLGATVLLTRSQDEFIDLKDRAELSNQSETDAFISLHYDTSLDPNWHGTTTYYFHENDFNLANAINNELAQLEPPNNGVVFGNYYVLRENNRPSILMELGYMTNDYDLEFIRSEEYIEQVSDAIVLGLVNYYSQ